MRRTYMHSEKIKNRAVIHYTEFLQSLRKVAKRYNVGKSTLARWVKHKLGNMPRSRTRQALHATISGCISDVLKMAPFSTAEAIIRAIKRDKHVAVSKSTVYRSIGRLGLTFKLAMRCRTHQAPPLDHPFLAGGSYDGDAISIDESSFYWNDKPSRGWGLRGRRVPKEKPVSRKRVSLILAVGKEGVVSHQVLTGGVKSSRFADFLRTLPDGRPIILDNCSIHKTREVKDLCAAKRITMRFTPPYCPWYNPVEFCFSEIKAAYRPLRLVSNDFLADVDTCVARLAHTDAYFRHAEEEWRRDRAAQLR